MIGEDHEAAAFEEKAEMLYSEVCRQEFPSESAVPLLSGRKLLRKETERVPPAADVLLKYTSNRTVGSIYHQACGSVVARVHEEGRRGQTLLDGSECAISSFRPFKTALGRLGV